MAETPVPDQNKFEFNLTKRLYLMMTKDRPPLQVLDKDDPRYKYKYSPLLTNRVMVPIIQTPLGDIWDNFFAMQGYGFCSDIEMRTMNCLEAYGYPKCERICSDYLDDLFECTTNTKQTKRMEIMRSERRRQYNSGERKIKYAPPPPIGTHQY